MSVRPRTVIGVHHGRAPRAPRVVHTRHAARHDALAFGSTARKPRAGWRADSCAELKNIFDTFLPQQLLYPNPTDPLNGDAATLMMREPEKYAARIKGPPARPPAIPARRPLLSVRCRSVGRSVRPSSCLFVVSCQCAHECLPLVGTDGAYQS